MADQELDQLKEDIRILSIAALTPANTKPDDSTLGPIRIRPLRRVNAGAWRSRDRRWTFLRATSDPHPQRWFTYRDDEQDPYWFTGELSLANAVANVEDYEASVR